MCISWKTGYRAFKYYKNTPNIKENNRKLRDPGITQEWAKAALYLPGRYCQRRSWHQRVGKLSLNSVADARCPILLAYSDQDCEGQSPDKLKAGQVKHPPNFSVFLYQELLHCHANSFSLQTAKDLMLLSSHQSRDIETTDEVPSLESFRGTTLRELHSIPQRSPLH